MRGQIASLSGVAEKQFQEARHFRDWEIQPAIDDPALPVETPATGYLTCNDLPASEPPGIEDASFADTDYDNPGVLGPVAVAASFLMKIFYLALCC